jgi:Tol biopolymer transport system component
MRATSRRRTDVFVRDMATATTRLVSVNTAGTSSGDGSSFANGLSISANGRYVVFESASTDLVAGDGNGASDLFRRDLDTNTTSLVSVNAAGTGPGNGASSAPALMTPDGRYVAFKSDASNLTSTTDSNSGSDIFRRDVDAGTTQLVSVNSAGTAAGNAGFNVVTDITPDGRYIAFVSGSSNLTALPDGNGSADPFRRDMTAGATVAADVNPTGTDTASGSSGVIQLSNDGRFAVFNSNAANLVPPGQDTNLAFDLFRRDFTSGTTKLISIADTGGTTGNRESGTPSISADGRYVSFESEANDLVGGGLDANGTTLDVYRRDAQLDTTRLISVKFDRSGAAGGSRPSLMSGGGILFISEGSELVPPGHDSGNRDLFLSLNRAPGGVGFTATPTEGQAPLAVAFEGTGSDLEGPVTYEWEFGDGATGAGASTSHTYTAAGTFTTRLTVVDADGARTSATRTVTVAAATPAPATPAPGPANPTLDPAPRVTAFSMLRRRFAVARGSTAAARKTPKGTAFRYTLSETARVTITIERAGPGRRKGTRCVRPTAKLRKKRKCTRFTRAGALTRDGSAGANQTGFTGRIGRKALRPGRYRATIVATDAAGQRSAPRQVRFVVARR